MIPRWDDDLDAYRRNDLLADAMVYLSLDVVADLATDLEVDGDALAYVRSQLRKVLEAPFQARMLHPTDVPFDAQPLVDALPASARDFLGSFYDRVMRYFWRDEALWDWITVLIRMWRQDDVWALLALPADSSELLREAAHQAWDNRDIQARVEAALARTLSDWDRRVATIRFFAPLPEDGYFGISDTRMVSITEVVRRQRFWKLAAQHLGADGVRAFQRRAQAFLDTQDDLVPVIGPLADPWMLAHPENPAPLSTTPSLS